MFLHRALGGVTSGEHCPFTSGIRNRLNASKKKRYLNWNEAVARADRDREVFLKRYKPPRPGPDGNCCELACMVSDVTEITLFKKFDPDTQWQGTRI